MWVYWAIFLWPALTAITNSQPALRTDRRAFIAFCLVLAATIGLRFQVGMDWDNYLAHLDEAQILSWQEILLALDPANGLLNWVAAEFGWGIWPVNLGCSIAFVSGVAAFSHRTASPWLAFTVSVPYMAIVMAMNYTRQGAAFGLVLWALIALQDGRTLRFVLLIFAAAMFHHTAAILMPLGVLATSRNRVWTLLWIGVSSVVAYYVLVAESQLALIENYIGAGMTSDGGAIRVTMNSVAAIVFILMRNRFDVDPKIRRLWFWYAAITLLFIPALIFIPSSTAVDRVALYFMPIQLFVFAGLPRALRHWNLENLTVYGTIIAYAIVQYVWFNYSNFYYAWLPYQFYPLVGLQR